MSQPTFPGGIDLLPGPQGPPIPTNALRIVTIGGSPFSTTDGITFTALGGGGSGTIHTSAPLSGDGSVGTPATIAAGAVPLTALATQAANTITGNGTGSSASPTALSKAAALSLLGIGAGSWRAQMFAFAQSKYSTIGRDVLTDFSLGAAGDYTPAITNPNGSVTPSVAYSTGFAGVELDTGATTQTGTEVVIARKGNPVLTPNVLTAAPWFIASRGRLDTAPSATAFIDMVSMTQLTPFVGASPAIGVRGATSQVNWIFNDGTTIFDTGVARPTANTVFLDFAIGFDGTTQTAYIGNVAAGTLVAVATSTALTGLGSAPGQPGAIILTSDTTRITADIASLYGACPNP